MDFVLVVIVVVSLISAERVRPTKMHKRLILIENRVSTLESRINLESDNTQEFYDHVVEMNTTLNQLQTVCQHASTSKTPEIEDTGIVPSASYMYQEAVERVLTAFKQEKIRIRSTADTIEKTMADIQHNMTKETDQNIQTVIEDFTVLKNDVQNINLTLINLQDEIQQYTTTDKENTSLLSAELQSYKENTALLSAELQSYKENTALLSTELQSYKENTALLSAELKSYTENTALLSAELQSYKENTALLSAEHKSYKESISLLVSRLNLIEKEQMSIGENYNEVKQDFKDIATSFDNRYMQKLCPNNWTQYGIFCYRLFEKYVTYNEAKRKCADNGAFIVDIQNQGEQEFVASLTKSVPYYWIGLTDIDEEGSYKWDRTNGGPTYLYWMSGQPNDGGDEDCVYADKRYGRNDGWLDYYCTDKNSVVCKKSL